MEPEVARGLADLLAQLATVLLSDPRGDEAERACEVVGDKLRAEVEHLRAIANARPRWDDEYELLATLLDRYRNRGRAEKAPG